MNSLIDGTTCAMHQRHRLEFIALHTRYITRTQQTRVIGSVMRPMSKYQCRSINPIRRLLASMRMLTDDQAIGKRTKYTCHFSIRILIFSGIVFSAPDSIPTPQSAVPYSACGDRSNRRPYRNQPRTESPMHTSRPISPPSPARCRPELHASLRYHVVELSGRKSIAVAV